MMNQHAFGPNLRRIRLQRSITLESIAAETNVPVSLWEALEDNDFYAWPSGVLARAFVREYARLIGVDPDETVSDFARLFPQGDRRRGVVMHDFAAIVGQDTAWVDERRATERREELKAASHARTAALRRRWTAAAIDVLLVVAMAWVLGTLWRRAYFARFATVAVLYPAVTALFSQSIGAHVINWYEAAHGFVSGRRAHQPRPPTVT